MNEPNKLAFNLAQAAEAIGVSRPTMSTLVRTEGFPAFRVGPRYVIPYDAFKIWLIEQAEKGREFLGPNASGISSKPQ